MSKIMTVIRSRWSGQPRTSRSQKASPKLVRRIIDDGGTQASLVVCNSPQLGNSGEFKQEYICCDFLRKSYFPITRNLLQFARKSWGIWGIRAELQTGISLPIGGPNYYDPKDTTTTSLECTTETGNSIKRMTIKG